MKLFKGGEGIRDFKGMFRGRLFPKHCHCFHVSGAFSGSGLVAVLDVRVRGTLCMFISASGIDFIVNFPNLIP